MMLLFKLLFKYLGKFFKFFGKSLPYLGKFGGMIPVGIFIVIDFFINWVRASFPYAFQNMAQTLFSAELVINKNVHLAVANAPQYNLWAFIQILISLYVFIALIKFLGKIQLKLSGAQSEWGAYMFAILVVMVIEVSAIAVFDGTFGFVPIYNGIVFLFMNMRPVFFNIFGASAVAVATNSTIIVANTTTLSGAVTFIGLFFGRKGI